VRYYQTTQKASTWDCVSPWSAAPRPLEVPPTIGVSGDAPAACLICPTQTEGVVKIERDT